MFKELNDVERVHDDDVNCRDYCCLKSHPFVVDNRPKYASRYFYLLCDGTTGIYTRVTHVPNHCRLWIGAAEGGNFAQQHAFVDQF